MPSSSAHTSKTFLTPLDVFVPGLFSLVTVSVKIYRIKKKSLALIADLALKELVTRNFRVTFCSAVMGAVFSRVEPAPKMQKFQG